MGICLHFWLFKIKLKHTVATDHFRPLYGQFPFEIHYLQYLQHFWVIKGAILDLKNALWTKEQRSYFNKGAARQPSFSQYDCCTAKEHAARHEVSCGVEAWISYFHRSRLNFPHCLLLMKVSWLVAVMCCLMRQHCTFFSKIHTHDKLQHIKRITRQMYERLRIRTSPAFVLPRC